MKIFPLLIACGLLLQVLAAAPDRAPADPPPPAAPGAASAMKNPSAQARHDQKVAAVKAGGHELVLIGDSITQCVGEGGPGWETLVPVWEKYYAPRKAINLGYSGYRTENILWNLENGELDFPQSPRLFVILIGTNNTDDQHYKSVHTGDEVFAGTRAIVRLIQARHPTAKILIHAILPCGGPGDTTPNARKYNRSPAGIAANQRANELTRGLADDKSIFWVDVGRVFRKPDGHVNDALMPDLIHPNAAGAEARARALEPVISKLLGVPAIP